jgi:hypothetical protein
MKRASLAIVAVAILGACGSTPANPGNDAGVVVPQDTGTAATCAHHIPGTSPSDPQFGTLVGRSFADFTLNDCDGNAHTFYAGDYCMPEHTFTVVSIAAGWCHPCQMESDQLTDRIVNTYGPHGVRMIQILVQDPSYNVPDGSFCHQWVTTHGLSVVPTTPFTGNYELLDPSQITNMYFPDGALPSTLIIDSQGIIRFHEDGASESLASLTTELDSLLGL